MLEDDEMSEAACDSTTEIICAKLHGLDIVGGHLAIAQAIDLYQALTTADNLGAKEEDETEALDRTHDSALPLQPVLLNQYPKRHV